MSHTPTDDKDLKLDNLFSILHEEKKNDPENNTNLHPQTMCPAFGGLRVVTRIDGSQVCMATDKGCMYGLTFVTHFYAARKSIVSPELMSDQLASGTIIKDIRASLDEIAKDDKIRLIPVVSLCVAETAGLAEELLPKKINNAEIVLVRLPAYLIRSHPEAKDIAVNAIVKRFADANAPRDEKSILLLGEIFPVDAMQIGSVLERLGVRKVILLPSQHLDDFKQASRVSAVAALHPFYTETCEPFEEKGIPVVQGSPVGAEGTYNWILNVAKALNLDMDNAKKIAEEERAKIQPIIAALKTDGTVIVAGYEGNEFPLVRLLMEAGIRVPYASTSIAQTHLLSDDHAFLTAKGTELRYRKYLEEDRRAVVIETPDLVIGTTSLDSYVKEKGIAAVYYTNIVSSRPLFFAAGAGAMLDLVKGLISRKSAYNNLKKFFDA